LLAKTVNFYFKPTGVILKEERKKKLKEENVAAEKKRRRRRGVALFNTSKLAYPL